MPKNKSKKVVQKLRNEKLRKIRYEFRTLLRLEKDKRWADLHKKFVAFSNDKSLSYDERKKHRSFIIKKQEELDRTYVRFSLCCGICGKRERNLVYNPVKYQWLCTPCYDYAHEEFPEEYP